MIYGSFNEVYEKFHVAKKILDVDTICNCIADALEFRAEYVKEGKDFPDDLKEILMHGEILTYKVLKCIGDGKVDDAKFFAYKIADTTGVFTMSSLEMFYVMGRVNYLSRNYVRAAKYFAVYDDYRFRAWQDFDELSLFYRANCFAMQKRFDDAVTFYTEALKIKYDFPEARKNLRLMRQRTNENLIGEVTSLWNFCDWQDVPIFINARDRLGIMKQQIDWLLDAGYRNLIILDNDSTYPKLLEYYSKLEKNSSVKVILLKKNLGYKALWKSNILEKMKISTPYVYTDPDVVPDKNCPKDFVKILYELLDTHREFRKVGPALVWEDITFFDKELWQRTEKNFEDQARVNENFGYANIDTTFALYTNTRAYSLRFSLRTLGNLRCRHLPWYFDYDNLPDDEKYYLEHADKSSSIAGRLNEV